LILRACVKGNGEAKDEYSNNDDDQAMTSMMVCLQVSSFHSTLQVEMFDFFFLA
jgi:hypothetical protein